MRRFAARRERACSNVTRLRYAVRGDTSRPALDDARRIAPRGISVTRDEAARGRVVLGAELGDLDRLRWARRFRRLLDVGGALLALVEAKRTGADPKEDERER